MLARNALGIFRTRLEEMPLRGMRGVYLTRAGFAALAMARGSPGSTAAGQAASGRWRGSAAPPPRAWR